MARCVRSRENWFLLTAFSVGGTEILTLAVMMEQLKLDDSGVMSAMVYICSLIGVALMGLFGSTLLRALTGRSIGIGSGMGCAALCIIAINAGGIWAGLLLTGLISFLGALSSPNITSTLSQLLGADRARGMARYQSFSVAIAVGSPMIGAVMISLGLTSWALVLASVMHLVAVAPWLRITPPLHLQKAESTSFWRNASIGYQCIFSIRALALMTASRLLNNLLYVGLPVCLPLIIGAMRLTATEAAWTQASGISALRLGALCSGIVLAFALSKKEALARFLPMQAVACGLVAVALLCVARDPMIVIAACGAAGLGQFAFRLSGTTFGPAVTPPHQLAHVILAGDTIVRFFSAAYGTTLVSIVAVTGQPALTLLCMGILTLPAPWLMRPAIRAYNQTMENPPISPDDPARPTLAARSDHSHPQRSKHSHDQRDA